MLDTNVLVSALLKRDSVPGRLLQAVQDGTLELVLSEPLLTELREVLNYPKVRKRIEASEIDSGLFLELLPFFSSRPEWIWPVWKCPAPVMQKISLCWRRWSPARRTGW